jgi:hypothetical protein
MDDKFVWNHRICPNFSKTCYQTLFLVINPYISWSWSQKKKNTKNHTINYTKIQTIPAEFRRNSLNSGDFFPEFPPEFRKSGGLNLRNSLFIYNWNWWIETPKRFGASCLGSKYTKITFSRWVGRKNFRSGQGGSKKIYIGPPDQCHLPSLFSFYYLKFNICKIFLINLKIWSSTWHFRDL